MRAAFALAVGLAGIGLRGETPAADGVRHGVPPDLKTYPQGSAREALGSVLKAVDAGKFDYLLAQLADPSWVDDRVARLYGGRFEEQVEDTRGRLDPGAVKLLRRLLAEGEWAVEKDSAVARPKEAPGRAASFRKQGERWYLENRSPPDR